MITMLLLGVIYLSFISLGLPDAILGVAIPSIVVEWGVSVSSFGIIPIIVTMGTTISSFMSGWVIKKLGTGKIAWLSSLMTGGSILGMSFAPSFLWMLPFVLPLGLGAGAVDAALNNYVALHFKARHMNWLHSFWGMGATLGPLVMGSAILHSSWHTGYRTIGIIQLSLSVILLAALPLWKRHIPVLSTARIDTEKTSSSGGELHIRGVKSSVAIMLLYVAGEVGVGLWGSTYLTIVHGYTLEAAASWMSMYYGGITAGRFLSGFVSIRMSNRSMIRMGILLSLSAALLLMLPLPPLLTGFLLIGIGLGFAPIFPSMIHETPVRFGSAASAKIIGFLMGFGYIGAALTQPFLGFVIDYLDAAYFPVIISLLIAAQLLFTEHLNRITGDKEKV